VVQYPAFIFCRPCFYGIWSKLFLFTH